MSVAALLLFAAAAIAPDVYLIPGGFVPGQQPDGNTVVFRARRGLVVVDTGRHETHTQKVVSLARELGKPLIAIVNTHWHLDHIGGNAMLRSEYPATHVYASSAFAAAREGFLKRYREQLEQAIRNETSEAQKETYRIDLYLIEHADELAPDIIISKSQRLGAGGRSIDVHLESYAVTAGDLWLYDRASRVLVSGDLVTLPVPFLDTACPARWSAALDDLAKSDFKVLIPGHGAPMSRSQFETYRRSFRNLLGCAASDAPKQACIDGWMSDASSLIVSEDPKLVRSMLDYYVGSVLRGDPAKIRDLCG